MDYLPATNDQKVFRHSSISQFKTTLSVMKRGEWLPIVADVIEYIYCDRSVSHKAGISDKPDIGFTYPVAECRYFSDVYLLGHNKPTLTEAMRAKGAPFSRRPRTARSTTRSSSFSLTSRRRTTPTVSAAKENISLSALILFHIRPRSG